MINYASCQAGKPLLIIAVILAVSLFAGAGAVAAGDNLAVYAGVILSANPDFDSTVLVDFPFSVNRSEFSFFEPESSPGSLYARVFAQVDLLDNTGYAIDSAATYFSLIAASPEEASRPDYRVFNRLTLMVPPGEYSARLTVIDVVSKKQGEFFLDNILVRLSDRERLSIGGTCVAYSIRYVGEDDSTFNQRMRKNGFHVVPNPVSVFADSDTIVYVYGEIYNLLMPATTDPTQYLLSIAVLDSQESLYRSFGSRIARKPGTSAVVAESFDISDFDLGGYKVQMIASDFDAKVADTAYVPFWIVSPQAVLSAVSESSEQVELYDGLSVQDHVNMVKFLLLPEQLTVLNSLPDSGKVNYLQQYWKEHDPDPTTAAVENQLEMIERYLYANKVFSTNPERSNGWASDRGRIYLTYGRWDERDDIEAPRVGNSYEVWYYRSIKEGKIFIFEDWSGDDDYRLVHSNVFGEVYSKDWQERIEQGFIDVPD